MSTDMINRFGLTRKPKPQNYPIQNQLLQRKGDEHLHVGVAAMQGFRENMEDAHCAVLSCPKHKDRSIFGVFDGHNGTVASTWMAEHLPGRLDELDDLSAENIINCCLQADIDLIKAKPEADVHGSTAVFAILQKDDKDKEKPWHVIIGNLGDSRLLVGHYEDDKVDQISKDHKPGHEKEEARIKAAGGFVARGRIDACLAVSRAFGDGSYKMNKDLKPQQQKVSSEPDIFDIRIGPKDFLFICCDGIFESFSNEKAVEYVRERLKRGEEDTALILSSLLTEVLQKGSKDNMTAMVIQLKSGNSYPKSDEFIPGEWYEGGNETFQSAYKVNCEWYGKSVDEAKAAWLERKKNLAAQKDRDRKDGKSVSDSSSSSDDDEPEPAPEPKPTPLKKSMEISKSSADKEASHGGSSKSPKSPGKDLRVSSGRKRGSVDSSSSDEDGKKTSKSGKRNSKDKEPKTLSWFAQKFGGPTARNAIVAATGLDSGTQEGTPGTPKEGSMAGRSKATKK